MLPFRERVPLLTRFPLLCFRETDDRRGGDDNDDDDNNGGGVCTSLGLLSLHVRSRSPFYIAIFYFCSFPLSRASAKVSEPAAAAAVRTSPGVDM